MTRYALAIILMIIAAAAPTDAAAGPRRTPGDSESSTVNSQLSIPPATDPYYTSYSYRIEDGDTILVLNLHEITCFPPLRFKNKKEEQFYWRTVRDVRRTLPYAKLIAETLIETYEYIETFPTKKEREQYLKRMEKELFEQYKPILKKFSRGQARVLVKLVQRETNQTGYEIVKAFLGTFRATFWQGFGKLFGVSLKSEFHPATDRHDAIIDRIATGIEQGWL